MNTLERLTRLRDRLEWEGRYTDANICSLAIEEITAATAGRDGTILSSPHPTKGNDMNTWIKKILQALGLVRGDLDAILGGAQSFATKLDSHAARASSDRDWHEAQADKHVAESDAAHAEAVRAMKVASNIRALFA